jgi:histone H3
MARVKQTAKQNAGGIPRAGEIRSTKPMRKEFKVREAKKVHRFRPGTVALRDIRRYQKNGNLLLPRLPFARLVREITDYWVHEIRFESKAISALHEAAEAYLVEVFEDSYQCAIHAGRVTLLGKDMALALRLRGDRYSEWLQ